MTAGEHTLTITTRYSHSLFNGTYTGFDLLRDQLLQWYPAGQVKEEIYSPFSTPSLTWKNLILTIPGDQQPGDIVMLTAHFDDVPSTGLAPGADDNASGSATLVEAARLLSGHSFPRTVKIVWFTGEEQGLRGSAAYAAAHEQELTHVVGVINLDMYAYDNDNDHCFEMHVGSLPASGRVGQCLAQAVQTYQPELTYDYFISGATYSSDHASFWSRGVGAIEIGENFGASTTENGCGNIADKNRYYHNSLDTLASINFSTAYPIHRAALAAFFAMASANPYKYYAPQFFVSPE
jgi:leucyl aminopeptidase